MRALFALFFPIAFSILGGCSPDDNAAMPPPFALTEEAMGRYCGMNVLEHDGPKGQIILTGALEPIWFSSARDAVAFTILPEEPKDIAAIYVSDMATAESWERPGAENWIDAKKAFFVIGSQRRGGMGTTETVPFSTKDTAQRFAAQHGGAVVRLADIPDDYALGSEDKGADADKPMRGHKDH